MEKHLLLKKAFLYPARKRNLKLKNSIYDNIKGYWVYKKSRTPCIEDENFIGPRTKKEDLETGEDQKSE